jgi:hypothetical protein
MESRQEALGYIRIPFAAMNANSRFVVRRPCMFVEQLSRRQQAVLLHYADRIFRVDGVTHPLESEHMAVLERQVEPDVVPDAVDIEELPSFFVDRRGRVAFFLEVMAMGYVDDDFDPDESVLLHKIAKALAIENELPIFRSWMARQLLLLKEASLLMED